MGDSFSFEELSARCSSFLNTPVEELKKGLGNDINFELLNKLSGELETAHNSIGADVKHDYSFFSELDEKVRKVSSKVSELVEFQPKSQPCSSLQHSLNTFTVDLFRKKVELREKKVQQNAALIESLIDQPAKATVEDVHFFQEALANREIRDRGDLTQLREILTKKRSSVDPKTRSIINACISSIDTLLYEHAKTDILRFKANVFTSQLEIDRLRSSLEVVIRNTSDKEKFRELNAPMWHIREAAERTRRLKKHAVRSGMLNLDPLEQEVTRFLKLT